MPLKCKQCGYRYPDTEEGKKKMDAHLDFHFRQNRRSKERAKRGLSRSWFVTESEWINGVDIETTSQHPPIFADEQAQNGTGGGSGQVKHKKVEELDADAHMVVVPSDSQGKPCPICGEQFNTIWNDSEEEWMYKNALNINGTVSEHFVV
jgi:pre-mRNA cleavage complex 2 protein Pcf11